MTSKRKKPLYQNINPTVQLVGAIVLFVVAFLASRGDSLTIIEKQVFYAFYGLPTFLYPFMYFVTQFGSIYLLGTLLAIYAYKRHYHVVLRLLLTGLFAYLLAGFAKSIWGRERPHELLTDVFTLDYFQGAGFPSGHVALAVALALTMGHYLPRKYHWIVFAWIIGVSISRIYLGVHLPLDIIGGFAIGWFAYALFRHVRIYDIAPLRPKKKQPLKPRRPTH